MLVRNDCRTDYRVLKEAGSLARAGYAVTIVAMNTYGPLEREQRDGFEIIRVPVEWSTSSLIKGINLYPKTILRMAKVARQIQANVYHAHDFDTLLPAWLAVRKVLGARLVYDAHEAPFLTIRDALPFFPFPLAVLTWFGFILSGWFIRHRAHAVITVNSMLADLHKEYYKLNQIAVVMNCPPRFLQASESKDFLAKHIGIDSSVPIIIYQGMLVKGRHGTGLENLVRSAPLLSKSVIVILGKGALADELKILAKQIGCDKRVFILPAVPPSELLRYTSGATIGVIPTQPFHPILNYSSPNKLFEYMAAGIPTVTGDLPIIRRICEEYTCGLVCDPGSPDSIAATINRLLDDQILYETMCAGASRAAQVYNWENQEEVLLEVYRQLLENHL